MLEVKLNKPLWERGGFPNVVQHGSESMENPWVNGMKAAPFDQCAYFFYPKLLRLCFDDAARFAFTSLPVLFIFLKPVLTIYIPQPFT
jgi:hypothetical protein